MSKNNETGKSILRSNPKNMRLNVVLSKDDKARIERLVELIEADTVTEVTKDAFRLLEYFVIKSKNGNSFYIKDPEGTLSRIEIFGITTK
ncbi:hypothetical protein HH303_12270 [Rhodospirillaceae bacterium KN72]|uniref:Uncharacterized protein n=1 Tax=Pacificispira spongiicola TaxID=2729598 RepID=A0A7Y0E104_9PROT|nr:hypothetical protein [Pacificispira spongiicola]NMM45259.1 hypothetical protein [Pacificispira spongiicola]